MTDQPKWTPGPWVADVVRGWGSDPVVSSASWPKPIAQLIPHGDRYYRHNRRDIRGETITTFGPETPEGEARKREVDAQLIANAHLIAAAPELYAALANLIARYDEVVTTPDCSCGQDDHDVMKARSALSKARGGA